MRDALSFSTLTSPVGPFGPLSSSASTSRNSLQSSTPSNSTAALQLPPPHSSLPLPQLPPGQHFHRFKHNPLQARRIAVVRDFRVGTRSDAVERLSVQLDASSYLPPSRHGQTWSRNDFPEVTQAGSSSRLPGTRSPLYQFFRSSCDDGQWCQEEGLMGSATALEQTRANQTDFQRGASDPVAPDHILAELACVRSSCPPWITLPLQDAPTNLAPGAHPFWVASGLHSFVTDPHGHGTETVHPPTQQAQPYNLDPDLLGEPSDPELVDLEWRAKAVRRRPRDKMRSDERTSQAATAKRAQAPRDVSGCLNVDETDVDQTSPSKRKYPCSSCPRIFTKSNDARASSPCSMFLGPH